MTSSCTTADLARLSSLAQDCWIGSPAEHYMVEQRQFQPEFLSRAKLGYAPPALMGDFPPQFRLAGGRVLIPMFDCHKQLAFFVGRITDDSLHIAKYWQSPFAIQRRFVVFGLADLPLDVPYIVVAEGLLDVLRARALGFPSVSLFGTNWTAHQVSLLMRYADTLVLCFDGDSKGAQAQHSFLSFCERRGLFSRVYSLTLPKTHDLDSLLLEQPRWLDSAMETLMLGEFDAQYSENLCYRLPVT